LASSADDRSKYPCGLKRTSGGSTSAKQKQNKVPHGEVICGTPIDGRWMHAYKYYKGFKQQKFPSNSLKLIDNHAI